MTDEIRVFIANYLKYDSGIVLHKSWDRCPCKISHTR